MSKISVANYFVFIMAIWQPKDGNVFHFLHFKQNTSVIIFFNKLPQIYITDKCVNIITDTFIYKVDTCSKISQPFKMIPNYIVLFLEFKQKYHNL